MTDKIRLPNVYHQIRKLLATPDAILDDYVEVINVDPALAARIIRIANSSFFGFSRKASTVKQAIMLIGVMQLHDLLLSILAIRAFSNIPVDVINLNAFWHSSVYCGITARQLAKQCQVPAREKLFTSGLLHDIGHIVMYTSIPNQVQDIIIEAQQTDTPLYKLEREKLGFDYGQVGKEIMRLWNLPENYWLITQDHLEPDQAKEFKLETSIVALSRALMLVEENESTSDSTTPLINTSLDLLKNKLDEKTINKIKTTARPYVEEVMDCLSPDAINRQQDCVILV